MCRVKAFEDKLNGYNKEVEAFRKKEASEVLTDVLQQTMDQLKVPMKKKNNCCLFERLLKVKKNGVFLFEKPFLVLEIFTFLYYANEDIDDVIGGLIKTV